MISTPVLAIAIPFLGGIGAPELIIILVIILVLFGPKRLPQLGKSLGKTMKAIREGAEGKLEEDEAALTEEDEPKKEPAKAEAKAESKSSAAGDEE
ncbi:MAG: twin-arginine translocase TatA/TatE family subunit [Coriobacteriia bacterium]|nr:twin-arginine translocase TatA/TatE family subunit [Coriobacteriia bacterium]